MLKTNKLRAFTLFEVMIATLLSAIMFGMALGAYRIVQRQAILHEQTTDRNYQQLHGLVLLEEDFKRCQIAEQTPNGILCKYPAHEIEYIVGDSFLVRRSQELANEMQPHIDTFYHTSIHLIADWNLSYKLPNSLVINNLNVTYLYNTTDSAQWQYSKTYSHQTLWEQILYEH